MSYLVYYILDFIASTSSYFVYNIIERTVGTLSRFFCEGREERVKFCNFITINKRIAKRRRRKRRERKKVKERREGKQEREEHSSVDC